MPLQAKTARSRRTRAALVEAVQHRLCGRGAFTAEEIARDAGCTAATFWAHFGTKDDAIGAAYEAALGELLELTERLFIEPGQGLLGLAQRQRASWSRHAVDALLDYFGRRDLLYRVALARLQQHRGLRRVYRQAEQQILAVVAQGLGEERPLDDARVVVAFCQGLSNPLLLGSEPGDRTRRRLSRGLLTLVDEV